MSSSITLGNADAALILRDVQGKAISIEAFIPKIHDEDAYIDVSSPGYLVCLLALLLCDKPKYIKILIELQKIAEEEMEEEKRKLHESSDLQIEFDPENQTIQ